ncbi:nitroreductase family protein [Pseudonocardia sp. WMMC193]|uniref:nitroreductase family protein n=1 Tax=Pseudonocardia sp. WMMC193 TaxID=2911965 RepID=UPI001F21544C|nr:nitroreductase family protein [Pseudonocardia sp. WMMC193]MCF7549473.1 nitroreductase family protein [Pseudonocardia sp. WMMC193]
MTTAADQTAGQDAGTPPPDAATYDQLLALARHRRSVRAIDPKREVSDETIEKILEVARWAPSAGNAQPWEFLVVRDPETRGRIADLYSRQMTDKREMQEAVWGHRNHIGYTGFRHSPVFVLVLGDPRVIDAYPVRTALEKGESHFVTSLAQATVFAHLAVASLGLGSQWISDVSSPYMSTMIKSWLGIPRGLRIYDMFGVGHPAVMPTPTTRRELDEIVHRDRYDATKARDQQAIEDFLWGDTLLGGFKSHNGLKGS